MYPKPVDDLIGFRTRSASGGANSVFVANEDNTLVAWGVPVAGKFGFEGSIKSSVNPKFVTDLTGLEPLQVSCGYGHVCVLVAETDRTRAALDALPPLPELPRAAAADKTSAASGASSSKKTTKSASSAKEASAVSKKSKKA